MTKVIGFLGGGNMSLSLVAGLVDDGYNAEALWVVDRNDNKRAAFVERFGVQATGSIKAMLEKVDVLVLAVKPQGLETVIKAHADLIQRNKPLVISVAAGINTTTLKSWLGEDIAVIRAMPNTPALIRSGATGLYADAEVSEENRTCAESLMRAVGLTVWVDSEQQFDALMALSGCGPAYVFSVMEALVKAGETVGLNHKTANLLTLQTVLGAARMAIESNEPVGVLKQRVMSKKGVTEQGVAVLEESGIDEIFVNVLQAAKKRAHEMALELGQSPSSE